MTRAQIAAKFGNGRTWEQMTEEERIDALLAESRDRCYGGKPVRARKRRAERFNFGVFFRCLDDLRRNA